MNGVDLETGRGNRLLDALTDHDLADLLAGATEVELVLGSVLYEPGEPVAAVHFPLTGVVSLVTDLGGGAVVEAASVGLEGMSGMSVFLGAGSAPERALIQVAGRAVTMSADAFIRAAEVVDGPLHALVRRYAQALFTQLARNAGCNRAHAVQPRTARWQLATADRMSSSTFELTQEFLAQMLNVQRGSVSRAARALADAGCITYVRGTLTVLDRRALESYACSCYQVVRDANDRVFAPWSSGRPHAPVPGRSTAEM